MTPGDITLERAISLARSEAHSFRLLMELYGEPSSWYTRRAFYALGLASGLRIAGEVHLHADPIRAMAVANEIRFLSGRYLEPRS